MILKWLPKAIQNRDKQIAFIGKDNPAAAIKQGDLIQSHVNSLVHPFLPASGRDGRVPGTRELVITDTKFICVFRVKKQTVEVMRILHSSQQYPPVKKKP